MSSVQTYAWQALDSIWFVAARFLNDAGYSDISSFVDALRAANPLVIDWAAVPSATLIVIPFSTS